MIGVDYKKFKQAKAVEAKNKKRWLVTVRQKAIMTALNKAKRVLPRNYRISLKSTLKSV